MVCRDCLGAVCVGMDCPMLKADMIELQISLAMLRASVKSKRVGGA